MPSCLPVVETRFFGRQAELAALAGALRHSRLVSVLGAPGIGKTRLVLEFLRGREAQGDAVAFCDLSGVATLDQARAQVQARCPANTATPCVLLLDNLEQLVEVVQPLVDEVLADRPTVRIVATSRVRLRVPGEVVIDVSPLGLPQDEGDFTSSEAGALLLDRLRAVCADSCGHENMLRPMVELLRRLDGLPLAIELAASCLRATDVESLLADCAHDLGALRGPAGIRRNWNNLGAALGWSWDLLSECEQQALCQCTVFRGGFDPVAIDAVVDLAASKNAPRPSTVIARLVESGLIRVVRWPERPCATRYELLQSVRSFVRARADQQSLIAARDRHARYYRLLSRDLLATVASTGDEGAFLHQRMERPNCRAAVLRRPRQALPENAVAVAAFTRMGDMAAVAQAHTARAMFEYESGRVQQAGDAYRDALVALADVKGMRRLRVFVHSRLAVCLQHQGLEAEANANLEAARDQDTNDPSARALYAALAGTLAANQHRLEDASDRFELASRILCSRSSAVAKNTVETHRGHLSLALSRQAAELGDSVEAERQMADVRRRLRNAQGSPDRSVRFAAMQLSLAMGSDNTDLLVMVDKQIRWVVPPCGAKFEIASRRAPREILRVLIEAREQAPGRAVTKEQLARAGWPEQTLSKTAIAKRVQTAIWYLRGDCGLKEVISSRHDGYLIASNVSIQRTVKEA